MLFRTGSETVGDERKLEKRIRNRKVRDEKGPVSGS